MHEPFYGCIQVKFEPIFDFNFAIVSQTVNAIEKLLAAFNVQVKLI